VAPGHIERVLELVRGSGILRSRDLDAWGIPRAVLRRMCDRGLLYRVGRGLYALPDAEVTESHTLAQAAKAVPQGVVCLLSALRFHRLTSQAPFEVWMAIAEKAWRPRTPYPPLRIMRFSAHALRAGVERHEIEGVAVPVYSPAKTVADCFKYRNKIGLDVALEALRDCREQGTCSEADLWQYAEVCRVARVMRPYLEATL
jgi:predicted transcriptional regulator of viral defense system